MLERLYKVFYEQFVTPVYISSFAFSGSYSDWTQLSIKTLKTVSTFILILAIAIFTPSCLMNVDPKITYFLSLEYDYGNDLSSFFIFILIYVI